MSESAQIDRIRPADVPPLFGGLTTRQLAFVDHYLKTRNATESARIAGYSGNEDALAVRGHEVVRSRKVQQEIKRRLGTSVLSAQEVLESLTNHAKSDLADVLEPDGSFNLRKAKRRGKSSLLKKLKVKTRYEKDSEGNLQPVVEHEFELHDAQAALVQLGKFHALFTEKVQQEASLTPESIELIGQSLLSAMQEAAARKRLSEGESQVIDVQAE